MSMAGVSPKEDHKCVFCSQLFSTKADLQSHFRLHANGDIDIKGQPRVQHKTSDKPNITSTGKTTTNTSTATTTNKNNAACDVCGEVFRTVSMAISHKFRKHPQSSLKHYCPHCGMMFPLKVNRDKHLLTHPNMTPKQVFPCHPCGVAFYNQRAKKFHMDSAHKGAIRIVNPIRTPAPSMKIVVNNAGEAHSVYYCHLCGCEYQVKYNLQKHLATKHTEEEREALPEELVQCNLCSAIFYTKRAYEAHSHHHREGDLFATNESMRQQVVHRIDQDFDQRRVPTAVERYLSASAVSHNRSATWRNIQASRRARVFKTSKTLTKQEESQGNTISLSPSSTREPDSLEKDKSSRLPDPSNNKTGNSGKERLTGDEDMSSGFTQGEYLCWGSEERSPRKKRLMDESEDDDGDMRSLGTVNPDCVMSNPGVVLGRASTSPQGEGEEEAGGTEAGIKKQRGEDTEEQINNGIPVVDKDSDGSESCELVRLELGKHLQLELEEDDVHEVLECHTKELSNEDLMELESQRVQEKAAEEPKKFTCKQMAEDFSMIEKALVTF